MTARVVLLHGLALSPRSMAWLERGLRRAGFRTLNVAYPSRRMALDGLVEGVHQRIAAFVAGDDGPVHFVGFSLGGLVARAYVARHRPVVLGRAVLLGTPNGGSELADLLGSVAAYRWFFGPAGAQLGTRPDASVKAALGAIDYPLGVIAGNRALDVVGWAIIPGANDGRVSVARTRVEGMADHLVLPVTHSLMAFSPSVTRATVAFLRHGRFGHTIHR